MVRSGCSRVRSGTPPLVRWPRMWRRRTGSQLACKGVGFPVMGNASTRGRSRAVRDGQVARRHTKSHASSKRGAGTSVAAHAFDNTMTSRMAGNMAVQQRFHSGDARNRLTTGGGSPLPGHVRAFMEGRFGADFSAVRLHTGRDAALLNRAVRGRAFTYG